MILDLRPLAFASILLSPLFAQNWVLRTTATVPPPAYAAAMAYDPLRASIVLFGGQSWNTPGALPVALGQTWVLQGNDWQLRSPGASPPARSHHGMTWNSVRNTIVVFGGRDGNGSPLNDLWEYDGTTWSNTYHSYVPLARWGPAVAFDGNHVIVFGGRAIDCCTFYGDTWRYVSPSVGWQLVATGGPPPRAGAGLAGTPYGVVLHGGRNFTDPNLGDTWVLAPGGTWAQVPLAAGPSREEMAMAYDPRSRQVFLAGGHHVPTASGFGNDLWRFDGQKWFPMATAAQPSEVIGPAAAIDTARDRLVMFGGGMWALAAVNGQTWEFGSTFPVTTFGTGCANGGAVPQLEARTVAARGGVFRLQVQGIGGGELGLLAVGFDATSWGGLPLPLPLASAGLPGCSAYLAPAAIDVLPPPSASAPNPEWSLIIPNNASLQGVELFGQALVANANGWRGGSGAVRAIVY